MTIGFRAIEAWDTEFAMRRTTNEVLMRRYLLGDLPREERGRLEESYLSDAQVFEELTAIQNDLIDAYVRGELEEGERQQFEAEYFRSPQRRQRVEFARALNQVLTAARRAAPAQPGSLWNRILAAFSLPRTAPRLAFSIAAILLVASISWLTLQNQRLRAGLRQALAAQAELRREQDTLRQHIAELEVSPNRKAPANQAASEVAQIEPPVGPGLRLYPGVARDAAGGQNTLVLSPTASEFHLQLMLEDAEYQTYEAVLLTSEWKEILRTKNLHSQSISGSVVISWRLPARAIESGDYVVQLIGQTAKGKRDDLESYSFRVLRR